MARKGIIQREKKRQLLVIKYSKKREFLKEEIKKATGLEDKLRKHLKLQRLPRNSAPVRLHNRCLITGRPKGFLSWNESHIFIETFYVWVQFLDI